MSPELLRRALLNYGPPGLIVGHARVKVNVSEPGTLPEFIFVRRGAGGIVTGKYPALIAGPW